MSIIEIEDLEFSDEGNASVVTRGKDAMSLFGLENGDLLSCSIGLGGAIVVFLIGYYLALRYLPQRPMNA